ncbi:DUF3558 family protein [Actinomycetospora flava]|uniref:DUF3558 domain-containing protein n=1 Tax=Actinomycetospora flava TaxID=3129232 RepID=A0ABU8M512_9PSEU
MPPAVVAEFGLGDIRVTVPGSESPEEPAGCKAAVAKQPPGAGGFEDDVTVAPFDRDIVGGQEASALGLEPTPPVGGLPAGLWPGWGSDECDVFVRTAPDQGLRVQLTRYRDQPGAESPCDLARRVAGSVLAWVRRAGG